MNIRIASFLKAGVDLVLPPRCPACGEIVADDGRFCDDCWSGLDFISPPLCSSCGAPFDHDAGEGAVCASCLLEPPRYASARAAVAYGGVARGLALALKHSDKPHLARSMAGHMTRAGRQLLDPQSGLLVPVPLHRWRLWSRGYNQALLLARGVAKLSGVPLSVDGLVRVRATRKSGHMDAAERRRNVRKAIVVRPSARPLVAGRRVILVDDVLTTGATADACAAALLAAGASEVNVLAFARVARN